MQRLIKLVTACIAGLILLNSCSHDVYQTGNFQSTKITADGDLSDWGLPLRFSSKIGTMQYSITNDNENIYIGLHTSDEATQMKILKAGVDIFIDPTGKENKKMEITFPVKGDNAGSPGWQRNSALGEKPDRNKIKQQMIMMANTFNVTGFQNIENRLYDVKDSSSLKVALKLDNADNMGYEMIIPFKTIFSTSAPQKIDQHKMSIEIVINALKQNTGEGAGSRRGNMSASGNGMGGMGRGMRRGGGGGGFNRRQSDADNANAPDKTIEYKQDANWYKFRLVTKSSS